MRISVTVVYIIFITTFIVGCGNTGSTSTQTPSVSTEAPRNANLIGGAIQSGWSSAKSSATFPAKFSNYSVTTPYGAVGIAGQSDNVGKAASFNHPAGITTDGTNLNLYVVDYNSNKIRKIEKATGAVSTLSGFTNTDTNSAVNFYYPSDITTDSKYLYVVDAGGNRIHRIQGQDSNGSRTYNNSKVLTIGSINGYAGSVDYTSPALVRFKNPTGITTDGTNLYVTDSGNHTIRKINISTQDDVTVTTFAGSSGVSGSTDGIGTDARFYSPARITTDGNNLYVTDFKNRTIRKIVIATRAVSTIAGEVYTSGGTDGTFIQPNGITTDGSNLYVTDAFTHTITKIEMSNGAVTKIAKIAGIRNVTNSASNYGSIGGSADGGGDYATFYTPLGITTDGTSLFVTDSNNNTIRQIK